MKAVYEMPKVSFEAFMANNAVSSCTARGAFDCVLGDGNGFDDYHGAGDQPANVMATTVGINGCTVEAGFADYGTEIGGVFVGEDNANRDDNTTTGAVKGTRDSIDISYETKNAWKKDGFMGWLYISRIRVWEGYTPHREYSQAGWYTDYHDGLMFSDGLNMLHAWLAPLFSTKSTSGM